MIPTPQYVQNPVAALGDQLAIELGLTEQQKQQIAPVLKAEAPQIQALKKDTSLKPLEKVEKLKQISSSVESQIMPLLNPEQQKKFQEIREQYRRELIEKMGSEALKKAEAGVKM